MAEFGLTPNGFELKRLTDIREETAAEMSLIEDLQTEEFLQPDFESDDVSMELVLVAIDPIATIWEVLQAVSNQYNKNNATGNVLSALVQFVGILRKDSNPSTVSVDLTGTPLATIPAGQTISDANNVNTWVIPLEFTFSGGGSATADAESLLREAIAAPAATLVKILTPQLGWDTVNNPLAAILGNKEETDTALRRRFDLSKLAPAAGPAEAVASNLIDLTGVTFVRVYINETLIVDANGLPGKTLSAIVQGGDNDEIAKTLLARSGSGTEFFGTTVVVLEDVQGLFYSIKWFRPILTPIFMIVNVTILDEDVFPADGAQQIKDAIVEYSINGVKGLGVEEGFNEVGFPPGEPIIFTRLSTPINFIPGHKITTYTIGLAPAPVGTSDIPISFNELGNFIDTNITVNVTP